MKLVEWIDDDGYKHKKLVRDEEENYDFGISKEPPPVDLIDWESVKRDLHNQLVNRGILSFYDLGGPNSGNLTGAILSAVKPHVIKYFREATNND